MQAVIPALSFDNTENAFSHRSTAELKRAKWLFALLNNNLLTTLGTRLTPWAMRLKLPVQGIVRATIFKQFCGGETLADCASVIDLLARHNVHTILDYGIEAKQTEADFDKTVHGITQAIAFAATHKHVPFVSLKLTGIARFALLEKLHSQQSLSVPEAAEWDRVRQRLLQLCQRAADMGIGIMIDAEESWIQQPIDDLADAMMQLLNNQRAVVWNTYQLYRHDRLAILQRDIQRARGKGFLLGAKLVRGAYLEKERKRATALGYSSPIHETKQASDRDFNQAIHVCLEHIDHVCFCVASHNEDSNHLAARLLVEKKLPADHPHVHFSQLYGMSDHISFNLARAGFRVSKYVPYGPVPDVIPYLMRRAQENTSVGGMSSRELQLIKRELKRRQLIQRP